MPIWILILLIVFGLHLIGMLVIACNESDIERDYNTFGHIMWVLFGILIIPLFYIPCLLACLMHKEELE